jgi:hypothetical protein
VQVEVFVGKDPEPWTLPEDFLSDRIEYFRAAFKSNFKEGVEKKIHLEEEDPAMFGRVVAWLFGSAVDPHSGDWERYSLLDCCKLFVLTDKLGIVDMNKEVLRASETKSSVKDIKCRPTSEVVLLVYKNTTDSSKLREILLRQALMFFLQSSPEDLEGFSAATSCHCQFNSDFLKSLVEHINQTIDECQFSWFCKLHGLWKSERVV